MAERVGWSEVGIKEGFTLEIERKVKKREDKAQSKGEKKNLDLKKDIEMDMVGTGGAGLKDERGRWTVWKI